MSNPPKRDTDSAASSIAGVRQAWLAAVEACDVSRLAAMVTDDIVVVHGNGRCISGREELKTDFLKGFASFAIHQKVLSPELIVRGNWAFEIADVESTLVPVSSAEPMNVRSRTVTVLRRQPDGSWQIARVLGLLD